MLPGLAHRLEKIISGGQTGADQGGLYGALDADLPTGGWIPHGFVTEQGPMPDLARFGLVETVSSDYPERTERNVKESDGTVIFNVAARGSKGSALTQRYCEKHGKPVLTFKAFSPGDVELVLGFIDRFNVKTLNVAGNRETSHPGIQKHVRKIIKDVILKNKYEFNKGKA
jgi:hypothetical protein